MKGTRPPAPTCTGSSRASWPKSPSRNGRKTTCCGNRDSRDFGPTRNRKTFAANGRLSDASQKRPPPEKPVMTLEEYQAKRDFRKTAEPPPRPGKPHRQPIFVVQEHH